MQYKYDRFTLSAPAAFYFSHFSFFSAIIQKQQQSVGQTGVNQLFSLIPEHLNSGYIYQILKRFS